MKKKFLLIFLATFIYASTTSFANGCNCYTVQGLSVVGVDSMKLTMINTCDNNAYFNLYIISSISPFDTLARQAVFGAAFLPLNIAASEILETKLTDVPAYGTYRVSMTNLSLLCDSVQFSASMGTTEIRTSTPIELYPNPGNGFFNLRSAHFSGATCSITVVDLLGKTIYHSESSAFNNSIDLSSLENGIYFVCIAQGKESVAEKKIIISK